MDGFYTISKKMPLGTTTCTFYKSEKGRQPDGREYASLEVIFPTNDNFWGNEYAEVVEDAYGVGLWFENNRLVDYDGIFQLNKFHIKCIRGAGYTVPREFEP